MPPRDDTEVQPSRLRLRDDKRSFDFPLAPKPAGEDGVVPEREVLILPEPSMAQLAAIRDLVYAADSKLDELAEPGAPIEPALQYRIDSKALDEEDYATLATRRAAGLARRKVTFSLESPHGLAMVAIVELLTGRKLTTEELPGWACDPMVCAEVLTRYEDPFAGLADDLSAALSAVTTALGQ